MMCKVIIFAVAIAVAVASENPTGCTPGATMKVDCNICHCAKDGSGFACTRMSCPQVSQDISSYPSDAVCEPGKSFKYYCNTCFCSKSGVGAACTRMACPPGLFNKDGTMNVPQGKPVPRDTSAVSAEDPELPKDGSCEAGKSYKKDCNTCNCLENDKPVCTQMYCGVSNESKWAPFYVQGSPCEPNSRFMSECNECRCLPDGRHAACTLKACPIPPSQE